MGKNSSVLEKIRGSPLVKQGLVRCFYRVVLHKTFPAIRVRSEKDGHGVHFLYPLSPYHSKTNSQKSATTHVNCQEPIQSASIP